MKRILILAGSILLAFCSRAEELRGTATVRAVRGTGSYSFTERAEPRKLHVGHRLGEGARIECDKASQVDLFLSNVGGVVRLKQKTSLKLTKLRLHYEGKQPVKAEAALEVLRGGILAGFKNSGPPIVYELRTPSGIFRTTRAQFRFEDKGEFEVLSGSVTLERNGVSETIAAGRKIFLSPVSRVAAL